MTWPRAAVAVAAIIGGSTTAVLTRHEWGPWLRARAQHRQSLIDGQTAREQHQHRIEEAEQHHEQLMEDEGGRPHDSGRMGGRRRRDR